MAKRLLGGIDSFTLRVGFRSRRRRSRDLWEIGERLLSGISHTKMFVATRPEVLLALGGDAGDLTLTNAIVRRDGLVNTVPKSNRRVGWSESRLQTVNPDNLDDLVGVLGERDKLVLKLEGAVGGLALCVVSTNVGGVHLRDIVPDL